ncbi:MAG: SDR family NAD(P)-dependent oxidoreductase [Proteobacteria bacterium]|nr:SDR family NAD(P)-dependent oxidoreductase [Pseudomonadota bacterium]MDA1352353.1 SDR family NAD(P)-dependent oxidoreductase [Pseudomonadota bacterium]|tara:strand:- start:86 stop:856 length:771 start_codon:yes stop_codon:yes gene_type:complete
MDKSNNPVAIITGGSRGVGKATAILLASKGWNITVTCTSSIDDADEVVKICQNLGVEAQAVAADVSDNQACLDTVDQTIKKWGRLDCLINNAGTTKFAFNHGDLDALDGDDFLHIYKVNVVGPFQMVKACRQYLIHSDNPNVINVSSIAGIRGIGSSLAYASSKGALNTMTKSMARNLGPIRVNAVCPGFIQGEWLRKGLGSDAYDAALAHIEKTTPLGLAVTVDQVAESIYNLMALSKIVTGETILLDGGFHLTV